MPARAGHPRPIAPGAPSASAIFAALLAACLANGSLGPVAAGEPATLPASFRPPSVPLVAHDPYFSIWSPADRLTDAATCHWTGRRHALSSLVRIDGRAYRVMGTEPEGIPALPQLSVDVQATRTVYDFATEEVRLTVTFTSPLLPDDLDILARPVTYVTFSAVAVDGRPHDVSLYFDGSSEIAVNDPSQKVGWGRVDVRGLVGLWFGSTDQPVLSKRGDDLRIDWGYFHVAAPWDPSLRSAVASGPIARAAFAARGEIPSDVDPNMPRAVDDGWPAAALLFPLGAVGAEPVRRTVILAYDDLWSIDYMGTWLRPYWRRGGMDTAELLARALADEPDLAERCRRFDAELRDDLVLLGGEAYARIATLAYRQALAGGKLAADADGMPLFFPKENFSNGCIATVDVIYPMAPLLLLLGPALSKAMLVPVLEYGASPRWKHPFAPHDLGTYPHATGQVYGGGELTEENQMPVEESGNLLILVAALARVEGNADFARRYWPVLSRWAEYLREKGRDPENQLSTDDFAGHLAHNVNLSAKAILALGAYADLARRLGESEAAARYRAIAEDFVRAWQKEADDGSSYRLAFDRPGTWSQKYNLVWDRILALDLFPEEVKRKEVAHYRRIQNRYGLPLDNRKEFTKLDWIIWSATLTGARDDFDALVRPVHDFLQESPDRVPMSDWYWTGNAKVVGFRARPVVGAVFVKLLDEPATWARWAGRGARASGEWAPMPEPPEVRTVVPASVDAPQTWRYTFVEPPAPAGDSRALAEDAPAAAGRLGWTSPAFDDSSWREGRGGFGTAGTPGTVARTRWSTPGIWLRREFALESVADHVPEGELRFLVHHDEDVRIYLNGVLAAAASGYTTGYQLLRMNDAGEKALRAGRNVLAVACRQTTGGQYIDVGIVRIVPAKRASAAGAGEDWIQLKGDGRRSGDASDRRLSLPLGLVAAVPLTDAILAAPAVADGRVFALDASGVLFAIDATDGRVLWKLATEGGDEHPGNVSSPAVVGGYVHFGTIAGTYYVVDAKGGSVVRRIPCGEPIFSAPAVAPGDPDGGREATVYFATLGSRVHAVSPAGEIRWTWDYVKEVIGWEGDRWSGEAWASRGERVTWKEQFCCSRDIALAGNTLAIPAGGAIVWLEDTGPSPRLAGVYAPRESPATLGLSLGPDGAVYRQWYRRDNGGRVEILRLSGENVIEDHVHGTATSYNGAASMGVSSVSFRGAEVFRSRPEEGWGLARHVQGEPAKPLASAPSISSPILVGRYGVFGDLQGRLHVVPLDAARPGRGGEAGKGRSGEGQPREGDAEEREAWSFRTAFGRAIVAPPAVADGRIYFGSDDGYLYILGPEGQAELPARDLELWRVRKPLAGKYADPSYDWFTSFGDFANTNATRQEMRPPFKLRWIRPFEGTVKHFSVFGGGRMYTHTAEGQVFAVEQSTGRLLWRKHFGGVHVSYTSPLYHGERLYLPQAGLERCALRCLDARTGDLLWEAPFSGSPSWNRQQPPIVVGGRAIYLFSSGKYRPEGWLFEHQSTFGFPEGQKPLLVAWDASTGKELWRRDFSEHGSGGDDAGMCLLDGVLYYSCYFGNKDPSGVTAAVRPETGEVLWVNTEHAVHAGCAVSGKDGRIYLGGYNPVEGETNRVWCLDARDGSLVWRSEPVSRAIHVITVRDDTLFTHAQYQQSYLLDRATGKVLGTFTRGYRCTRFTVSEPYLLGANMDVYDLAGGEFRLVSTGPATDVLLCVGAQVSNGRMFFTTNGAGLQSSHVWGEEARE